MDRRSDTIQRLIDQENERIEQSYEHIHNLYKELGEALRREAHDNSRMNRPSTYMGPYIPPDKKGEPK